MVSAWAGLAGPKRDEDGERRRETGQARMAHGRLLGLKLNCAAH